MTIAFHVKHDNRINDMRIILALYDKKAELYLQPFFVQAIGVAFRNLADEIARGGEDNLIARHPEDFLLVHIGHYDEENGTLHPQQTPKQLCEIADLSTKIAESSSLREPTNNAGQAQH